MAASASKFHAEFDPIDEAENKTAWLTGVAPMASTLDKYQPPRVSVRFHDHRKTVC
jgi:hypothetical protein